MRTPFTAGITRLVLTVFCLSLAAAPLSAYASSSVTIIKRTIPDGAEGSFDFEGEGFGGQLDSFTLSDGQSVSASTPEGGTSGMLREIVPEGWDLTDVSCTGSEGFVEPEGDNIYISVEDSGSYTCTFTNTKRAHVTITKQTIPDDSEGSFEFSGSLGGGTSLSDGESTEFWVVPGQYSYSESVPDGWELSDIDCGEEAEESDAYAEGSGVDFQLEAGDDVSCTFTNQSTDIDDLPTLTIIKRVINDNGGSATVEDFTLKVGDSTVRSGDINILNAGDYYIGEIENIDYDGTFSGDCDVTNGFVNLKPGDHKTCVITNNDRVSTGTGRGGDEKPDTDGGDVNASHEGSETNRLEAIARFIAGDSAPPGGFGGGVSGPFSADEKAKLCSMKKAPILANDALIQWFGELIAGLLGRPDAGPVIAALKDQTFCAPPEVSIIPKAEPLAVRFNKDGIIMSKNIVWNQCVRGHISLGLIKRNTDTVLYRQGTVEVYRPMTCSNYHPNSFNVWRHPDFSDLFVTLDGKGHLVGSLPSGYIAVKGPMNADIAEATRVPDVAAKSSAPQQKTTANSGLTNVAGK